MKSARTADPELDGTNCLHWRPTSGGGAQRVRTAVSYWAGYPTEIDAWVAAADDAETVAEVAWRPERGFSPSSWWVCRCCWTRC